MATSQQLNLTSAQIIELSEIGNKFIYEGVNDDIRLGSGGIIKIIQKYNEMISSQTEISDEEIDKASAKLYSTPHGSWGFVQGAKWYRERLKQLNEK